MSTPTPPDPDPTPRRPGTDGGAGEAGGRGRSRGGDKGEGGSDPAARSGAQEQRPGASDAAGASGPAGSAGSAGSAGGGQDASRTEVEPPVPFTQQLGRVTIVVLAVLFGVFAVANSQRVDFSWVVGETTVREGPTGELTGGVPLILLLLGAFVAGAVIAILTELYVARARRSRKPTADRGKGEGKEKGKKNKGKGKDQPGRG